MDDGSRNTYISGGGVTNFITSFEAMVREDEPRGLGVPVITLLLEGGTDSDRSGAGMQRSGVKARGGGEGAAWRCDGGGGWCGRPLGAANLPVISGF